MMKRWILVLALGLLTACSSTSEKEDGAAGATPETPAETPAKLDIINKKTSSDLSKAYESKNTKELFAVAGQILTQNPYDAQALNVLALHHIQKGEWGAARILIEKALEKNKDIAGLHNNLGVIALREDNLEAAYLYFKTAYSKDSRNPNVLSNLASIYVKYLDYNRAEPLVEAAYSAMPDSASVTNNMAIIRRVQGRYDDAAALYKKVLDKEPRNVSTMINYAILLVEYMKKYDEGEKVLNKLEFLESSDPYARTKITELNTKVQAARK